MDGSRPSLQAAEYGFALAEQLHSRLTLLSVWSPPEVIPLGPLSGYLPLRLARSDEEVAKINQLFAELSAEHQRVEVVRALEVGPVTQTICAYAEQHGVELIVTGARGLGMTRQLLLGSVSHQVVQHAHCPVLVWRDHSTLPSAWRQLESFPWPPGTSHRPACFGA